MAADAISRSLRARTPKTHYVMGGGGARFLDDAALAAPDRAFGRLMQIMVRAAAPRL